MLNFLMQGKGKKDTLQYAEKTKDLLAQTLSHLLYFKTPQVQQIFQSSQLDIRTSKTIFSSHIYQVCPNSVSEYFKIFLQNPSEITVEPFDLAEGYAVILNTKSSSHTSIEFTKESHVQKALYLLPSFYQNCICKSFRIEDIAVFNQVQIKIGKNVVADKELNQE